ncbi:hypothetical protein GSH03_35000, partial [Burkholderia pseudomallei]|nr:hypothetical protein [Burkholderia pseudomallei]MBM5693599.1 hypothetical protein [Burkholderia pseudomallei]
TAKSSEWRVAGRYSVDGVGYVALVAMDGRLRAVPVRGFSGQGVRLTGEVDGKTVAGWTGVQTVKTEQYGGAK